MSNLTKKQHWSIETLEYFSELKKENEDKFLKEARRFIWYRCELTGEIYDDLLFDLINQVKTF